jgi:hypothetical protein
MEIGAFVALWRSRIEFSSALDALGGFASGGWFHASIDCQRMRLALDVGSYCRRLQEGMTVVIEVIDLAGNIVREFVSEIYSGSNTVADAGGGGCGTRVYRAIPIETIYPISAPTS